MPPAGLSGQPQNIVVVPVFPDPADPRNAGGPQGKPGKYAVIFTLHRPGIQILPENRYSFAGDLRGDSHLAMAQPAFKSPDDLNVTHVRVRVKTDECNFIFDGAPNDRGFLAKLTSHPFDAADLEDAHRKAYRAIVPILSDWSLHLDIPLSIYQVDVTELATGTLRMSITTPFREVPFALMPQQSTNPEFRALAALYREALNSNSTLYQFLCLFKIIEGIERRRGRLAAEARARREAFSRPKERVPEEGDDFAAWLNAIFHVRPVWDEMAIDSIFVSEARGKSFKFLVDTHLRPLRLNVAHVLSDGAEEVRLSADETLDLIKINRWLPLTKCIARRMLKNEFPSEFLSFLGEDGRIIEAERAGDDAERG